MLSMLDICDTFKQQNFDCFVGIAFINLSKSVAISILHISADRPLSLSISPLCIAIRSEHSDVALFSLKCHSYLCVITVI